MWVLSQRFRKLLAQRIGQGPPAIGAGSLAIPARLIGPLLGRVDPLSQR
jgi:hypothetical protein